jgi:hypothetical protein
MALVKRGQRTFREPAVTRSLRLVSNTTARVMRAHSHIADAPGVPRKDRRSFLEESSKPCATWTWDAKKSIKEFLPVPRPHLEMAGHDDANNPCLSGWQLLRQRSPRWAVAASACELKMSAGIVEDEFRKSVSCFAPSIWHSSHLPI